MEATPPPSRSPPPPPPAPQIPQDPFSEDLSNIDTSYTPHHHHYSTTTPDFSPPSPLPFSSASSIRSASPSSTRSSFPSSSSRSSFAATATAIPMTITRPTPAYTSSPYVFERNPDLPMPVPYEELTPPHSPQHSHSSSKSAGAGSSNASFYSASAAVGSKIAPLLTRAGSVLASTSPKRASVPSFPSSPTTRTIFTTPASSRPGSPSKSNLRNSDLAATTPEKKAKANPMSAAFADIFTVKGSSAPMSFGLVQTSPKRETLPAGAVFGPSLSAKCHGASACGRSSRTASPKRPGHSRRGSTFASTAANFLGLSVPARQVGVGGGGEGLAEYVGEDGDGDEITMLDLERELGVANGAKDVDTLLANASILFSKMQGAYRAKRTELVEARRERAAAQEELAEQCTRAKHLKRQLGTLAERVEESEAEAARLRAELEERNARARTIRMVDAGADIAVPGERLFSAGSVAGECSDSSGSGDDEGRDSADEEGYSRPSSASSATSAEADVAGMPWRSSVVPFLPPGEKVREENEALKKRIGELEEIVNGCLGLVDA